MRDIYELINDRDFIENMTGYCMAIVHDYDAARDIVSAFLLMVVERGFGGFESETHMRRAIRGWLRRTSKGSWTGRRFHNKEVILKLDGSVDWLGIDYQWMRGRQLPEQFNNVYCQEILQLIGGLPREDAKFLTAVVMSGGPIEYAKEKSLNIRTILNRLRNVREKLWRLAEPELLEIRGSGNVSLEASQ